MCASDASADAYPGGHSCTGADANASPNIYACSHRDSDSVDCDTASDFHSDADINATSNGDAATYINPGPDASICCCISNTGAYYCGDRHR